VSLRSYVKIWLLITVLVAYEAYCLNYSTRTSFLYSLQAGGTLPKNLNLSPDPGKTVSLWIPRSGFSARDGQPA
jgi:hypothetical protein